MAEDVGLVDVSSSRSVEETVERLKGLLQAKGIVLFTIVDHGGEASKVGMTMAPTKLLIFGSPSAGTPLMQAAPRAGVDLPLKILVWQDAKGKVWLTYNRPSYLIKRHGLPEDLLPNIAAIDAIARSVAG